MNLVRSILKVFSAQIASRVLAFIGLTLFARRLGAYELGVFFLFQSVIGISMLLADLGLRGALEKRVSEGNDADILFSSMILMKVVPISVLSIGILIFQNSINKYVGEEIAVIIILAIIIEEGYQVTMQLLNGELRVSESANMIIIRQAIWLIGGWIAITNLSPEAIWLIYFYIIGALIAFFWGINRIDTSFGRPTWKHSQSLFEYAKYDVVSGAGSTLYSWLDVAVIGILLSQTEVGAYETAWRLSAIAITFSLAIQTAIFPQMSSWSSDEELDRISNVLTEVITGSLFFIIPAFIGVLLLSEELLEVIFGKEFIIASGALIILMAQRTSQALNQTIGKTLQAIDRPDLAAYSMVLGIVLNISLNFVLVWIYGIIGAAFATFISYGAMTVLRGKFLSNIISVNFEWTDIGWCMISSVIMGIVVCIIKMNYIIDSLPNLVIIVISGVLVYIGSVMISPTLRNKVVNGVRHIYTRT